MLIERKSEHLVISIGKITIKLGLYRLFKKRQKAIVLLEQGGFGDYVCCRPFFKELKKQNPDLTIIYVCQDWTAAFSKVYDKDSIDKVIGFNRNDFKTNIVYRRNLMKYINRTYSIEKYIHLTPFLLGYGEQLSWRMYFAKAIKAKEKYIAVIKYSNNSSKQLKFFNKKIEIEPFSFCIDRNKQFFEKILETKIDDCDSYIKLPSYYDLRKNIIISVGASHDAKMYDIEKWVHVLNFIVNNTDNNTKILFIGTYQERDFINKLFVKIKNNSRFINLAGEIDISALPIVLQSSKLMISMESGNTHLAHALNCPTICLSGGYYYNCVQPYRNSSVSYVYPPKFWEIIKSNNKELLKKIYFSCNELSVKDILPEQIIKVIEEKQYLK